eukprot:TRINITY_DN67400_c0_g1_i1.p1 TRINITY_DN67400_c0_g1~~TRINITY_DN67400_c0_g1_i1.p1  ORF type:complete len:585 (+),score=55.61 TRINITY_DN67400_c0_g1_i1:200-1756(+)
MSAAVHVPSRTSACLLAAAAERGRAPTFHAHGVLRVLAAQALLGGRGLDEIRLVLKMQHRAFDAGSVVPTRRFSEKSGDDVNGAEYHWSAPCDGSATQKTPTDIPLVEWLIDGPHPPRGLVVLAYVFGREFLSETKAVSSTEELDFRQSLGFFEVPLHGLTESGNARDLTAGPFIRVNHAAHCSNDARWRSHLCSVFTLQLRISWEEREAFLQEANEMSRRTSKLCEMLEELGFPDKKDDSGAYTTRASENAESDAATSSANMPSNKEYADVPSADDPVMSRRCSKSGCCVRNQECDGTPIDLRPRYNHPGRYLSPCRSQGRGEKSPAHASGYPTSRGTSPLVRPVSTSSRPGHAGGSTAFRRSEVPPVPSAAVRRRPQSASTVSSRREAERFEMERASSRGRAGTQTTPKPGKAPLLPATKRVSVAAPSSCAERALTDDEVVLALRQAFRTPVSAFRAFDGNGDGLISLAELEHGLVSVALPGRLPDGMAGRLLRKADVDGLGSISMGRFGELLGFF